MMKLLKLGLCASLLFLAASLSLFAGTESEEFAKGLAAYRSGQFQSAIQSMQIDILKNPDSWQAYAIIGYSYYKLEDRKRALEACETSLEIHPDNTVLRQFADGVKKEIEASAPAPEPTPAPSPASGPVSTPAGLLPESGVLFLVNAGIAHPISPSDLTDIFSTGYQLGLAAGYSFLRVATLTLSADGSYMPFQGGQSSGHSGGAGSNSDWLVLANALLYSDEKDEPAKLFFTIGAGLSSYQCHSTGSPFSFFYTTSHSKVTGISNTSFAYRLGLGVDFRLEPRQYLFAEADYVGTSTGLTDIGYMTFKVGFKTSFDSSAIDKKKSIIKVW